MFCDQCGAEIQEGISFCPNCGNRVAQELVMPMVQTSGQMPVQTPAKIPGKNKKWLLYGGIGAAAILLIVFLVSAVFSLFVGKGGRVLTAIAATAKDAPLLVEDLQDVQEILSGDQYMVGIEAGVEGGTVKGEFRNGKKDKQVYISMNTGEQDDLAFLCGVHSGVLRASAQGLDYAFFYDPKQDNDGFLSEDFRESELKKLNGLLEGVSSDQMSAEAMRKNMLSALKKEFKNITFEKAEARKWRVNGKERKCKGYRMTLDEDNIIRFCEAFSESTLKSMKGETKDAIDDVLDALTDTAKDMEFDADLSFYLYKGKLAAVVIEEDYGEIRVEFQGGDYRMQNMVVAMESDSFSEEMTIRSERKGKTETTTIETDDVEMTIVYNAKSGEVSFEGEFYGERCSLEGVYKHSGSKVSYTLEDIRTNGSSVLGDAGMTMYAEKKPGIEKYKGEKFDLGNASREDFEKLAEDLEEYIDAVDDLLW